MKVQSGFFPQWQKLGRFGFRIRARLRWRKGVELQIVAWVAEKVWRPDGRDNLAANDLY